VPDSCGLGIAPSQSSRRSSMRMASLPTSARSARMPLVLLSPCARMNKLKAWVVRWEWATTAAAVRQPVAAVLRPQTGPEQVRRIVELLYATHQYAPDEMLNTISRGGYNPYPARFGQIRVPLTDPPSVVEYAGEIVCGHNPYLVARIARVWRANDGSGGIAWVDEPHPSWE
jgi:hypothetical protein